MDTHVRKSAQASTPTPTPTPAPAQPAAPARPSASPPIAAPPPALSTPPLRMAPRRRRRSHRTSRPLGLPATPSHPSLCSSVSPPPSCPCFICPAAAGRGGGAGRGVGGGAGGGGGMNMQWNEAGRLGTGQVRRAGLRGQASALASTTARPRVAGVSGARARRARPPWALVVAGPVCGGGDGGDEGRGVGCGVRREQEAVAWRGRVCRRGPGHCGTRRPLITSRCPAAAVFISNSISTSTSMPTGSCPCRMPLPLTSPPPHHRRGPRTSCGSRTPPARSPASRRAGWA